MSLDYDKINRNQQDGHTNWWTSYADLFMMLSVVFLLMYVSATLRSGTAGYMKQLESEKISKENSDLKEQIKVYTALKDQQLQKSSEAEQQVYSKLMDKLKLLREESKTEKESLQRQANENQEKEFALNQYQQVIRNIIDTNILAKAQINRRENIIVTKDQTIQEKEQLIAQNEQQITEVNQKLKNRIEQIKRDQKHAKLSRKETEKRIAKLRREGAAQLEVLQAKQEAAENDLKNDLKRVKSTLVHTEAKIGELQTEHEAELKAEREAFQKDLERQNLTAEARARKLKQFAAQAAEKAKTLEGTLAQSEQEKIRYAAAVEDLKKNLAHQNLTAEARARKLKEFAAQAAQKASALEGNLARSEQEGAQAAQKARALEGNLARSEEEKGRYITAVEGLKKEKAGLQGDLEKTRAQANARKSIAESIGSAFKKAGIKADLDPRTGVVTLDFGEEYFDTGRAELKANMREKLNRFFPIYTDSLFNNPKSADKIANVEIIGFASSTYKGKYVNPNSLLPGDQEAVAYNLKLSFSRANEIFKHIYGRNALTDGQKKKLLPLIKVVGRGYLPEGKTAADIPDGISEENFCKNYNCKRAQKVIVKFNLKD